MVIKGGYKAMVHGIQVPLDVHTDLGGVLVDVANTFNTILHKAIF